MCNTIVRTLFLISEHFHALEIQIFVNKFETKRIMNLEEGGIPYRKQGKFL